MTKQELVIVGQLLSDALIVVGVSFIVVGTIMHFCAERKKDK